MAIWDFARIWRVSEELAERVGFYYRHFQQLVMIPTDSENTECLCRVQALSEQPLQFLQFPLFA
jgi:hypothetical protein